MVVGKRHGKEKETTDSSDTPTGDPIAGKISGEGIKGEIHSKHVTEATKV